MRSAKLGGGGFEIVAPSVSILAEPPVSVVDKNVDKRGTRKVAKAYLQVSVLARRPENRRAQRTIDRATPRSPTKYAAKFPGLPLFTVDEIFGGWQKAQATHFTDGGTFDQIYAPDR